MSEFCQDCSIKMFGKDFRDLAHTNDHEDALCEVCGPIIVDSNGKKIGLLKRDLGTFFAVKTIEDLMFKINGDTQTRPKVQ
jgi:hypothetical protein